MSRHDPERTELPSFDIVRLACTQALVGEVIPEMLGATVGYSNDEIHFIIYYDRDLTEELEENLADIAVTIEAYFFPVLRLNIEGKVARERADLVPLKCWVFLLKLVDGDELIRFPRGK